MSNVIRCEEMFMKPENVWNNALVEAIVDEREIHMFDGKVINIFWTEICEGLTAAMWDDLEHRASLHRLLRDTEKDRQY